jgi:hypothetical protein
MNPGPHSWENIYRNAQCRQYLIQWTHPLQTHRGLNPSIPDSISAKLSFVDWKLDRGLRFEFRSGYQLL